MERSQNMNAEELFVSDRKKSVLLLYKHFCNNVFLGQWEAAKADARQLSVHDDLIVAKIKDVLLDIIRYPYDRSVHGNIASPYHLSWLCLQEYLNLGEDDITQDDRSLRKNTEFQFLLFEACKEASDTVIKELHRYHGHICLPDEKRLESVHLSSELQLVLQELLTSNPVLGHSVIQALIAQPSGHAQFKKNNDVLQNVYILSIQNVLEKCSKFCTVIDDSVNRKKKVDTVKTLLTLYNPDSYQNYLPLRELFSYLFELSSVEGNAISRQEFLSCLTGKRHPYLLQEYCKLEHELELKTSPTGYTKDDSLFNYHRYIAHLMKQPVRSRLKWLMLLCLNEKQHLLKIIVETAIEFIRCGEFQELGALLEPEELQPLRVFILLHGWSYCQSCTQAKVLLETLLDTKGSCQHPALEAGCRKLAYQIDLIQWCLDRTKPLLREDTSCSSHQQRAADMFLGLENHSVLYVLHQSTRISSLDQEEVLSILHKSPAQGELGGSFEMSKKKTKSVRFSFQNDNSNNMDPDIHIERWKDISIFSGFCAIKNVMDAIYFCAENHDSKEMQNYVYKHSGVSSVDKISEESSSKNTKNFQQIYDENVKTKLKKTRNCLSKLQPLTFRVEILENIYSLLFVTHEDIQEVSVSAESDSGELDEYENSRNNTLDDDSLRLSIVSEISEEGVSPTLDKTPPVFDKEERTEHTVTGSYDEPFVETTQRNKSDLGQVKASDHNKKPTNLFKEENFIQNTASSKKLTRQKSPKPFKIENIDAGVRGSGNGSTHSTESTCSGSWFGFLTPDYLVLEILAMLKDSLLDLGAARFKVLGGKDNSSTSGKSSASSEAMIDTKLEQPLTVLVESGIGVDILQSRIAHLTQYVHEAQWRFQLICHDRVQKQAGEMSPIMRSDNSWDEDKEMEMFLSDVRTRRRSLMANKSSLSPDSEKQIELRHEDQQPVRSRSHSRRQSRGRSSHRRAPGIIPLMLSSPDTLLNMCIRRGNYAQASQVTKLLKLEDRPEVIEVPFSLAYNEAIKKLHGLNVGGFGAKSMKPGKTSMNALASVAAAGVATISINSVADKLLSVSQLPRVPRRSKSWGIIPSQTEWCFQQENAEAVILFDLFCFGCRTWEMCNNMVDVIKSHLNVPKTVKDSRNHDQGQNSRKGSGEDVKRSSRTDLKTKSLSDMLRQFEKLLHLGADIESGSQQNILIALYKHSIQTFLQTATLSLSSEDCKTYAAFVSEMKKNVDRVENAILITQGADNSLNLKKESPSPSPKKSEMVDRQTIHAAIKHLIQMLNRDLPVGGLCSMFTREVPVHCHRNRDFLLSLYEHVKGLSFVVAENEADSKETMVIPKNYFVMLEEGPISILGRLIFSRRIPPVRLEKVAKELSLNLTHIIVHSCCPSIPSKHNSVDNLVDTSNKDVLKKRDSIVMNSWSCVDTKCSQPQQTGQTHPEVLLRGIVTRLLHCMKDAASRSNARGIFDVNSAVMMMKTTDFDDIIKSTQKLLMVDLDLLKTQREKFCFFGNLQNLMTIHLHLHLIKETETQNVAEVNHREKKLFNEMNLIEQITQLKTFSYFVGQIELVSLFDLQFIINRHGLQYPLQWDGLLEDTLYDLDKLHPWYKYVPEPDPRLVFVTTICSASSPPFQVLDPELIQSQLEASMKQFLVDTVTVDKTRNTVTIPEMLSWYKNDFSKDQDQALGFKYEGIMHLICSHMSGQVQADLQELLRQDIDIKRKNELPFQVGINLNKTEFFIPLDFSMLTENSQRTKTHRRITSLPKNLSISGSSDFSKSTSSSIKSLSELHQLTQATLDYIKTESPLVATLVSLICSDELDDIEEHFDEDYFKQSDDTRSRTASEMSLVDVRSYRYQKLTEDYPVLKRHLLNFVIPIAGAEDPSILKGRDALLKLTTSSFSQKVKDCMLNLHDNWQFQKVVISILNELFQDRKWREMISILNSLPITVFRNTQEFTSLHDFTLCALILKWLTFKPDAAKGQVAKDVADSVSGLLHQIMCPHTQTRLLLSVHGKLPIDHNIELFQMCENRDLSDGLRSAVVKKLTELHMFYRITECAKNLQFKLSMKTAEFTDKVEKEQYHASLDKFTDWRNSLKPDVISPEEVLAVLMKAGDFDTAKAWCHHAQLSHSTYLDVVEHHLVALLGRKPPNMFKAFQVLEESKTKSEEESLTLCQKLLKTLANQRDVLFVVSFMLNQFDRLLTDQTKDELRMLSMGAKVLLCLPDNIRGDYSHLVTTPVLLIEQLLMNMKVDLAGKAYEIISCDQVRLQNQALRISLDQYDNLVSCYATKALEFYTAQVIQSVEKVRSPSQMSSASVDREEAFVNTPVKKFQDSVRGRNSVDFSGGVRVSSSAPSGGSSPNRTTPLPVKSVTKFVMPAEPPPREKWTPDHTTDTCMLCKVERFSMFNRRHHCRRCGRVVCASCSTKTTVIHGAQARTCDDCFAQTYEQRRQSLRPDTGILSFKDDGQHGSSVTLRNARAALQTGDLETYILHHTQPLWKLKVNNKESNETVREDFFYEQAPSTSLCLSILELHSSIMTSGHLALRLCDDLSKHLKPIAPGLPNPEVDYSLVISMMKTLLFHAKMKYIKCGETQSMAQCELYQSRIDLLALLVADNYQDLPSLQELTKSDVIMRLRDKLIEDERLALAVEVSTKCGLDAAGVWAAWGMIYLQSGDFTKAREKFSRCLKSPSDRDQIQQSSKLLRDIVDCLDSMSSCNELQCLMVNPSSTKNFLSSPTATNLEESNIESAHFQECLYYLRTYGTFYSIVEFNRRHGYWMKAVQFILDHKCSSDVFVEALLAPALDTGRIGELIDQLVMIDPSLEKWNTYLTASCRYLVKHKLYHVLYDFQVFMKDFIRAAMTCVTYFYLSGAQSYIDLSGRIHYLYQAHQHMQAYLDPSQWGDVKCPHAEPQDSEKNYSKNANDSVIRLVQSTEEVTKHMRTMGLQIEVTKYLQECLTNTETDATSVAVVYVGQTKSSQLPSMFSNAKGRVDLINMVLLSGDDVRRAYDIAKRIMKECKLGAPKILTHAAREMAKLGRFDHIRVLHECITNDSPDDEDALDELIGACILVISDNPNEAKETDNLIKMLRKDSNKINAYILCGKLRSAYLMAVKSEREEDVQRIAGAAQRMGQTAVKNICNKWLQQRHQ